MKTPQTKKQPKSKPKKILLGEGLLNWTREERVSDRYGCVHLAPSESESEFIKLSSAEGFGLLFVKIMETRKSYHVGDLFRGFSPGGAKVGQTIKLGVGSIFYEEESVGVKPPGNKKSDWLSPKSLYKCHFQTVQLWFTPQKKTKSPAKKKPTQKNKKTKSKS